MSFESTKYSRLNHLYITLQKYEGIDEIPCYIMHLVTMNLKATKQSPSIQNIRKILTRNGLQNYYDKIISIQTKLNNTYKQNTDQTFECPICLENNISIIIITDCKHIFCKNCTTKIIIDDIFKCPLCRQEQKIYNVKTLTKEQIFIIMEYYKMYYNYEASIKTHYRNQKIMLTKIFKELNIEFDYS